MANDICRIEFDEEEKHKSLPAARVPISNNHGELLNNKSINDKLDDHLFDNIHHKIINISPVSNGTTKNYSDSPATAEENVSFHVPRHPHIMLNIDTDFSLLTFKANLSSFILSIIFLIIGVIFNLAVLAIIHERVPFDQPPLPDISFDLLPKYDAALYISEYIIMFISGSVLMMIVCHHYRWIILSRLCVILGLLYMFRALCMAVTQVPVSNPQYYCSPRINLNETSGLEMCKIIMWRIVYLSVGMGLSVNGHHTFCGDFIFSGHTVILVTCDLFLMYYWLSNRKPFWFKLLKYFYHLLVAISVLAISVARGHYLVDIILALVISKLIFYIYHLMCHYAIIYQQHIYDQSQQNRQPANSSVYNFYSFPQKNPLNAWWYRIFEIFEKNSIRNQIFIKNSFQWPWLMFSKQPIMMVI